MEYIKGVFLLKDSELMKRMIIEGGHQLTGTIPISGAKNSAVALIPASILCDEEVRIDNVPNISDIAALEEILEYLGASISKEDNSIIINSRNIDNKEIPESISKKLRASYYFMSSLLGKYKKVEMYFPGGCNIGARPIDQTLKGYRALGATVIEEGNKYTIYADELKGARVYLDMPSVGATVNTLLASVKATGKTVIENAAKEPEIVNIATFLNNMGAKISGAGTSKITITGVPYLHSATIETIPDRIEAGTYVIAGALIGNNLCINNIIPEHIDALINKLKEMGVNMTINDDNIIISQTANLKPINVKTLGYPGFATDLQQPFTALLTQCKGTSIVEETIYESRMGHIPYLNSLGANITGTNRLAKITGPSLLKGTTVTATDLRAGACMVLAGLIAEGQTIVEDVDHILRGYENIVEKLTNVGAKITIEEIK